MTDFAEVPVAVKVFGTDSLVGMRDNVAIRPPVSTLAQTVGALLVGLARDIYSTSAQANVPRGIVGHGAITTGTGGANGTFPLAFTGGNFDVDPTGTFTVVGGAVTTITFTTPGEYIGAAPTAPTLSFAASSGLTGAAATATVGFLIAHHARYWTLSADGTALVQYRNVAGVAEAITPAVTMATSDGIEAALAGVDAVVTAEADRAEAAANTIETVRRKILINGDLPVNQWIEPNDYTDISWTSGFPHKRYSDGLIIWHMLPQEAATRKEWEIAGGPRVRNPDDGKWYVGVNMASVYNSTMQGVAVIERWVDVNTGNNANAGTIGAPFKTVPYALSIINGLGAGTYQIWVSSTDFIPGNSEGWDASAYVIGANVKLAINILPKADGTQPIHAPGMRRTGYMAAQWAFADIGDGWFKSTAAGISAGAKNTPIGFNPSVRDADGHFAPYEVLTGVYADDAAVKAAGAGRNAIYRRTSDNHFYIRPHGGTTPIPGTDFFYVEFQSGIVFRLSEGARLYVKGLEMINNGSVANVAGLRWEPASYTLGPTQPVVVHDIGAVFEECAVYGTSGNAFFDFGCTRSVIWNCRSGYNWLDAVNQSSPYTPGNSNGVEQGAGQWMLVEGHLDADHGPNGFKDQPTVNTSSNGPTGHSLTNMEINNSRFSGSNGSGAAFVGGARCLPLNVIISEPKYVTPGADVFAACWLASGNSAYDVNRKSEIAGAYNGSSCRPNAKDLYVGPTAKMTQAHYRKRTYTKQVDAGGILKDGFGGNL